MSDQSEVTQVIAQLVEKARKAQQEVENYTQEQIDQVCLAIGWEVYKDENIAQCARLAVEETGMGRYEDKLTKHKTKVMGVLRDVIGLKSVGLIERDEARGISKYAKPVGVIGALTPVTNPTATPASNAIMILKGRNAVIFAPHPRGKKSCKLACEMMRQGLAKVGAPLDLIQYIEEPSLDLSQELMRQVDLVVATGGTPMVKAAYSSGTPAYGVGTGNAVMIIADDADIADATNKVHLSKIFDNATSCSSENSVIIHESIYDQVIAAFQGLGGYLCSAEEKAQLEKYMWVPGKNGHLALNAKIVGQSAASIAAGANISVPEGTTMLMVEGSTPGAADRFSGEKLSPVLTLWRYQTIAEAIACAEKLTNYSGYGHSCGIYTFKQEYIEALALRMKSSRIMVRQPMAPANGGNFFNGMPSTVTLGCGTWGGNITTENVNWKHMINVTWVSEPIPPKRPTDEAMWGAYWQRFGK